MIELNKVDLTYKNAENKALKNIHLRVKKGECILLSGRSGCGKTSLLRLMNGLVPYFYEGERSGVVIADTLNIDECQTYEIAKRIGMVYQNPRSQFFNVDAESELAFGLENLSYPREEMVSRIERSIRTLKLEKLIHKGIYQLSGGEKQKIAFGSIYAMAPKIYLLDEPSANLDKLATDHLKEQLNRLKAEGKTIILTEHRVNYLKGIVDRVVYMDDGQIENIYDHTEFFNLDHDRRVDLGLRNLDDTHWPSLKEISKNPSNKGLFMEGLKLGYNGKAILEELTFSAEPGHVIGVIGPNGAGKSTLAEVICGLKKPMAGQSYYKGKKIQAKDLLKHAYMVMQDVDYQLFADSVENECYHGLSGVNPSSVHQALEALNLLQVKDVHPATLSGGQKQRLAIAVGLVCQKDILVFDEPTSGLDYDSMLRVSEIIKKLSAMGKIIFLVTHDEEFTCEVCSHILSLPKQGGI